MCAIKDYYIPESSAATLGERIKEDIKSRQDKRVECLEELAHWDGLYRGRYTARYEILGAKPVLLLPYGHEIEVLADRWKSLPSVLQELRGFAKKERGFKYIASDLRWRHVLQDSQGRIFLCHLASLEELEGEDIDEVVYKQLRILLKTMVKVKEEEENKEAKDEEGLLDPDSLETTLAWIQSTPQEAAALVNGEKTLYDFFDDKRRTARYIESLFPKEKEFKDLKEAADKSETKAAEAVVSLHLLAYFRGVALTDKDGVDGLASLPSHMEQDQSSSAPSPAPTVAGARKRSKRMKQDRSSSAPSPAPGMKTGSRKKAKTVGKG